MDPKLFQTIELHRRSIVVADLGMATRSTMLHWAFDGRGTPLVIVPKLLHQAIRKEIDHRRHFGFTEHIVDLISPANLRKGTYSTAGRRVMHEIGTARSIETEFAERYASDDANACVRILGPYSMALYRSLVRHGFVTIFYRLDDALRPIVRVTD